MCYKCPSSTLQPVSKGDTRTRSAIVLSKMASSEQWTVQYPHLHREDPQATLGLNNIYAIGYGSFMLRPAMAIQTSSSKKTQVVAPRSKSTRKSHRASLADVENTPRRECMTPQQLKILNSYYVKDPRPTAEDFESLSQEIQRPVQKVVNWFNNRRAKERRLHRHSSLNPSPLSQSFSMNVDSDAGATESGDDDIESEDDQDDPNCVAAMHQMSRKEVDVAFILCNIKRRIISRQSQQNDVFLTR